MTEPHFGRIEVPRPLRFRLTGVLLALRGKDVLFDQGARVEKDGQSFTLGKLAVALWVATDDPMEAHRTLAQKVERVLGRAVWDEPLEKEMAGRRDV